MNLNQNLRSRGYRSTRSRTAVLSAVQARPRTVAEIHHELRQTDHQINLSSVYRSLDVLNELGMIQEVHTGDGIARYERSDQSHHHHLICKRCGTIRDIQVCDEGLLKKAASVAPFQIDDHRLEFIGVCGRCSK